jgi:hypothetical protein
MLKKIFKMSTSQYRDAKTVLNAVVKSPNLELTRIEKNGTDINLRIKKLRK